MSPDDAWSNMGDCRNAWIYVIFYTLSLFVIQLTLNSILHHKFARKAQFVFSMIVPISVLAFFIAQFMIS